MAATACNDDEIITGINVTPLVDVTLVLLVILMVTASYVASRSIPMELPKSATASFSQNWLNDIQDDGFLTEVVNRWRMQAMNPDGHADHQPAGPCD